MKRLWALILILTCLSGAAGAETTVEEEFNATFRNFSTLGGVVAVIRNGEITYTHAYGTERIGGDPITADTLFQVGSISKMVANIGLMQLLDEHGISLDDELGTVLGYPIRHPEHPNTPVTFRQLMTHTASLRDSGDYDHALQGSPLPLETLFTRRSAYTFFSAYEPGTRRQYSNFGGGLIGCLVEKLSGQTLDAYMAAHVFEPLGITAAYQASLLPEGAPVADMYRMPERRIAKSLRSDKTHITSPDPETHYFLTAGKLIISANDLSKLLIALCDGGVYQNTRILRESVVSEMITRQNRRGSVSCESGHGLFMNIITDSQVEGRTMYGHGGKAYGMLCAAYFDPTDRTGVVMLTNGCQNDRMYQDVGMLGRAIMRICYQRLIDPVHQTEDPFAVTD